MTDRTPPRDRLTRAEIAKDALQHSVSAGAETVAGVTGIVSRAVRDIADQVGDLATEMFEIRDAARRARAEHDRDRPAAGGAEG